MSTNTVYRYMNALSHSLIHSLTHTYEHTHTHTHTRVPGLQDKRGECSGEKASSLVCKAAHVPTLPYIPCVCVYARMCVCVCVCACVCAPSLSFTATKKTQRTYCAQGRKITPFSEKERNEQLSLSFRSSLPTSLLPPLSPSHTLFLLPSHSHSS